MFGAETWTPASAASALATSVPMVSSSATAGMTAAAAASGWRPPGSSEPRHKPQGAAPAAPFFVVSHRYNPLREPRTALRNRVSNVLTVAQHPENPVRLAMSQSPDDQVPRTRVEQAAYVIECVKSLGRARSRLVQADADAAHFGNGMRRLRPPSLLHCPRVHSRHVPAAVDRGPDGNAPEQREVPT